MKRFWIMLLAITVASVMALPAGAKGKPDKPGPPPPDEPLAGETCYALGDWGATPVTGDFTVTLGGDHPDEYCIDVMSDPGDWEITYGPAGNGNVRSLNLFLRDSTAPGDGCVCAYLEDGTLSCGHCGYTFRDVSTGGSAFFHQAPEATANACGTEFAEYVGSKWIDGIFEQGTLVTEQTGDPSPLSFMPSMRGNRGATVTLTVDLPGVGNNDPYDVTP